MSEQNKSTLLKSLIDDVVKAIGREFENFENKHAANSELEVMSADLIAVIAIASSIYVCNFINQLNE